MSSEQEEAGMSRLTHRCHPAVQWASIICQWRVTGGRVTAAAPSKTQEQGNDAKQN